VISSPKPEYLRRVDVFDECDLPAGPHIYQIAWVESVAEVDGIAHTHIWTPRGWVRHTPYDEDRDVHESYLIEEPLRWPKTPMVCL
jgi:hypothetical protein